MKQRCILVTSSLACIFIAASITGCSTPAPNQDLVLEELKEIRSSLNQLNQNFSKQAESREKLLSVSNSQGGPGGGQVSVERLLDIHLLNDPTVEDVKRYIQKIKVATEGQRSFLPNDPQVTLYMEVGKKHIPELINALSTGSSSGSMADYHILPVIERLMGKDDKTQILQALSEHPCLIRIVLGQGWEGDARDILVEKLKSGQRLSTDWIKAVARLRDPESYPLLRQYLISADSRSWTYEAIKDLPIEDLEGAVNEAWVAGKYAHEYDRQRLADIAVTYGNAGALEYLIHALNFPAGNSSSAQMNGTSRFIVLRLVDFKGSDEELAAWFAANKKQIEFDPASRRFVVKNGSSNVNGKAPSVAEAAPAVSVPAQDQPVKSKVEKKNTKVPEGRVAAWTDDVEQAKAEAIKYDLPILLLYTAPSWCGYCRKLDDQLITQDDFKAYANKNLVLLIADYSDREKGDKWGAKNKELIESCPIGGFPHMYLLTSDARNLGSVEYYEPKWSVQDYLDKMEMLKGGTI